MTALSKVERLEFVEMIFARLFIVVCFLMFFVTGCAVDGVDGGEPVPKFVIRYIFSQPAFDPRRSDEYDYWLTYELENGVWHFVYIEQNPLTMDVINKAVADDIARLIEIYEKTD